MRRLICSGLRLTLAMTVLVCAVPPAGAAHHSSDMVAISSPQVVDDASDTLLVSFSKRYEKELLKRLGTPARAHMDAPDLPPQDLPMNALISTMWQTLEETELLEAVKEYARQLTQAELTVHTGGVHVSGPSVFRTPTTPSVESPASSTSFRLTGRMDVTSDAHVNATLHAQFKGMESRLMYFPWGDEMMRISLSRSLSHRAGAELSYRWADAANSINATMQVKF